MKEVNMEDNRPSLDIPYQQFQKRWKVFLRPILLLPFLIILLLLDHGFDLDDDSSPLSNPYAYWSDLTGTDISSSKINSVGHEGLAYEAQEDEYFSEPFSRETSDLQLMSDKEGLGSFSNSTYLFVLLVVYIFSAPVIGLIILGALTMLSFPVASMIVIRDKYPSWWYDWNVALTGLVLRIFCFAFLLTDKYPSVEHDSDYLTVSLPNPNVHRVNRYYPLFKWLLVLPLFVILILAVIPAFVIYAISFIALMITGRLPRFVYNYQVWFVRLFINISAYTGLYVTDAYPHI